MAQRYKNKNENKTLLLIEFLDFLKFKIANGTMSKEETDNLYRSFVENSNIYGTITDLSAFYHQTPNNVKVVINRKLLSKPKRTVLYSFNDFARVKPDGWNKTNH